MSNTGRSTSCRQLVPQYQTCQGVTTPQGNQSFHHFDVCDSRVPIVPRMLKNMAQILLSWYIIIHVSIFVISLSALLLASSEIYFWICHMWHLLFWNSRNQKSKSTKMITGQWIWFCLNKIRRCLFVTTTWQRKHRDQFKNFEPPHVKCKQRSNKI